MQVQEFSNQSSPIELSPKHEIHQQDMDDSDPANVDHIIQNYQSELHSRLKKSFFDENQQARDIEFKSVLRLFEKITQEVIQEPQLQKTFDLAFLRLIVKLSSEQSPFQMKQAVILLQTIFTRTIISKRLLNLKGVERTVIDLINVLLTLKQSFRQTYLELPITHVIQAILDQLESNPDKVIMTTVKDLRKTMQLTQEQKDSLIRLRETLMDPSNPNSKNEFLKALQISLSTSESLQDQFHLFQEIIQDHVIEHIGQLKEEPLKNRIYQLQQIYAIFERYIYQSNYTIMLELHNIHDTKTYTLKTEKQLIINNPYLYYGCAELLNQILILPQETQLQLSAFYMIRRLFHYFPQLAQHLKGPILLVLRNITVFNVSLPTLKEPTIFLYRLINKSDYDEEYKNLLRSDSQLFGLRDNKYFSVKALSYTEDSEQVYTLKTLNIQVMFPCYTVISAASLFNFSVLVEKSNSIIYWNFKTLDYDLQFGLYRLTKVEDYGVSDYVNERNGLKCLIKIQRMDCHKQQVTGVTLITNPGFYRIIFVNTSDILQGQQLLLPEIEIVVLLCSSFRTQMSNMFQLLCIQFKVFLKYN